MVQITITSNDGQNTEENLDLSDEGAELLKATAANENGAIRVSTPLGKSTIIGGDTPFGNKDNRDFARWEQALDELLNIGLVKQVSDQSYNLTSQGWSVAKDLS